MPKTNQIQYLSPSRPTPGATYHWKPSPKLRKLGWTNQRLGTVWPAARDRAIQINDELEKWLAANQAGTAPRKPPKILRWRDLEDAYKAHDRYLNLKRSSKDEYDSRMRWLKTWALDGELRLADLDRPMIVNLRDTVVAHCSPYKASAILRVLGVLCMFGYDNSWLPLGLATELNIPTPPKRRHRVLIEHLPWLADAAADHPHIALGVVLGFYTMQREADLLATTAFRFRPVHDISSEARRVLAGPDGKVLGLHLEQGKTSAQVGIPLVPRARTEVEAALAAIRTGGKTVTHLIVKSDRRCHEKTFQRDFRRVVNKAADAARSALEQAQADGAGIDALDTLERAVEALTGLQFRDLRRSGMCWLRELTVPIPMIASISGHSIDETTKILDTYLPRDTRSAAEGMAIAVSRQAERDAADQAEKEQAQ